MLIQEYQPGWAKDFNRIKEVIKENLSGIDIEIEHIGSTAIKDLAAKPIVDIDIVYSKPESFEDIKVRLEKLGYYHAGNQGIDGREVFKPAKLKTNHLILDSIKHHLYVCHADCKELLRHLIFRDYLREHEKERKEYEVMKYAIAKEANQNKKGYAKLKETMAKEFVESIMEKAGNKK